jgi:signal transduction histidine kinase
MGIQTQSALIAAVLLLALGVNVLYQRRVAYRRTFAILLGSLFAYNLAFFLSGVVGGPLCRRLLMLAAVSVPWAALRFFDRFLGEKDRVAQSVVTPATVLAVVVLATSLADSLTVGVLFTFYVLTVLAWCVWRLYAAYRTVDSRAEGQRLLYLVVGGAAAVVFAGLDLLPTLEVPFPSVGHLFMVFYMYFWMQVIQRSRLLDLEELLGRGLSLLIQGVVIALVYTALVVWVGGRLGLFFFNTLLASIVLIFLFEPLKQLVTTWLGRLMFQEKYELQMQLAPLRRELAGVIGLPELAERLLARLEASRRITQASVFLIEGDERGFFMKRAVGQPELQRIDAVTGRPFLEALRRERVLVREHLVSELAELPPDEVGSARRETLEAVLETMDNVSADLSFAFLSADRLLGFLNVQDERLREPFSSDEIRLIAGIAAQAAIVVENSELFERLKERDRLSVLGEMAAGLAHEIRNPLGAIKGAGQLLSPKDMEPEQGEFVQVILEEVERLDSVVRQFLDYARPYRGRLQPMEVGPVVERLATLLRAEERDPPVRVAVDLAPEVPPVMGDADQILQICLNLARNACEAMAATGGELRLSTALVTERAADRPDGQRRRVEIRVADTGPGIPEDVRRNLFVPFFTTKKGGTGLGLAISQRIAQNHGGEITVRSRPGRGTTMTVRLPLAGDGNQATGEHRRRLEGAAG